jgi:hypothetical protein
MGVTWGDVDRDGWPDLYVTNMFSSAGQRTTTQPKYGEMVAGKHVPLADYQRFAKGNTLYRNLTGKGFEECDARDHVQVAFWCWSAAFADLDNDGWEDLATTNGYITGYKPGDL